MGIVKSICSCLKTCADNRIVPLSVPLALLLSLSGVAQSAVVTYCCDQAAQTAYQTALDTLGFSRALESFEDGAWVAAQTAPQPSPVTNLGITWSRDGAGFSTSDGGGSVVDGSWIMFTDVGGSVHAVPDGYTLTAPGFPLYGVGGWFTSTQAKLAFIVDGDTTRVNFTGTEATVTGWTFLGFIEDDPTLGFNSVEILEVDEVVGGETRIFASDAFTLGGQAGAFVPLPAALPLFGTGLMVMIGFLGRRGKRT